MELKSIALPDIPSGWELTRVGREWARPGFKANETAVAGGIIAANFPQKVLLATSTQRYLPLLTATYRDL